MSDSYFFKPLEFHQAKENREQQKIDQQDKEPFGMSFAEDIAECSPGKTKQAATGPTATATWSGGPDSGPDWDF